ncbi:hypothetical protein MKU65_07260 [Leptospira interrogans]|nr:hypothetical protein [Leptospira interrogans]MCH1902506.1 hypothetical protein [Leptospira interrogans]
MPIKILADGDKVLNLVGLKIVDALARKELLIDVKFLPIRIILPGNR